MKLTVSATSVILLIAALVFICRPSCGDRGSPLPIPHHLAQWLSGRGYGLQTGDDPKPDRPPKPKPTSEGEGSGYVVATQPVAVGDTVPVELDVVEYPDGFWARVTVGPDTVYWEKLEFRRYPTNWRAGAELVNTHWPDWGIYAGRRLFDIGPVEMQGAVAVDADPAVVPEWAAVEARAAVHWSTLEAGVGAGYRVGQDQGLHLSAGVGIRF